MRVLQTYDFSRPSRSRYAPIVKALVDDGAPIVEITRGDGIFAEDANIDSMRGAIAGLVNDRGRKAKTFVQDKDTLIITLHAEGEEPKRKSKKTKQLVAA